MADDFLLYGATGYTGRLIARRALELGLRPTIAGRDLAKVSRLARELGLAGRAFALHDRVALDRALGDAPVVMHAAGPFESTWQPMVQACLRSGTHYLDLTGEVDVIEAIAALDQRARDAAVMLLPGVGFDLVPTDALASHVVAKLPGATRLAVAVGHAPWLDRAGRTRQPGLSRGTMRSALDHMLTRGLVRRGGRLVEVEPAAWCRRVGIGGPSAPPRAAVLFPLGELAALYRSTGVPDIETYVVLPSLAILLLRRLGWIAPLLRGVERFMPEGPSEAELAGGEALAWAEASDPSGNRVAAHLRAPQAYAFTADSALAAVQRVLRGEAKPGYQTPTTAFGTALCFGLRGVRIATMESPS